MTTEAETAGPPELLHLKNADSSVALCPDLGATLAYFRWRDHDILRPAPANAVAERRLRQMACYPLVPFSNRVAFADLPFGGKRIHLRANAPPESHALHGFGWQRAWQVHARSAQALELRLRHEPDEDWPFACEAAYSVELRGDGLHLHLSVKNCGEGAMPAGLGLHPFFPLDDDTGLEATWHSMWEMDADKLPTINVPTPAECDFRQRRLVDQWQVDNCFCGWGGRATLFYATHRVHLRAGTDCSRIFCYAPGDERRFVALEPVSHINNAFVLADRGVADTGMRALAPGEGMEISFSITPEPVP